MRDLRTYGRTVSVEIEICEECKYTASENAEWRTVRYSGLVNWEIVTGEDAEEIEAMTDGSCIDEYHEYLVLHFEDGNESTFRNSHVDMFRI